MFAGLAIPQLVIAVAANPLLHVLVPILSTQADRDSTADAWAIVLGVGLAFGGLGLLLFWSAPVWVPLLVPGFTPAGRLLTVALTRVQVLGMALMGVSTALRSVHNARQRFVRAAICATLGAAVGVVFLVVALPRLGVTAAAWSFTIRSGVEFVLLLPMLGRYPGFHWRAPIIAEAWRRLRPLMLGASYDRTELVLDRFLSSLAPPGGLSLLYLAQQIYGAAGQVLNRGVADPVVPRLSRKAHEQEWRRFRDLLRHRLVWVVAITMGAFVALFLVGRPALQVIFGVRNLRAQDVLLLWWIMVVLAGLLLGDPLGHLLSSGFYATADTATPAKITAVTYTVGVLLKVVGFWTGGVVGIAAATSAYYVLRFSALYLVLERRLASVSGTARRSP